MKANIPDSIIIRRDAEGVLHHSYWTTDQQLVPFGATIYIRKNALLEWAEAMKRICKGAEPMEKAYQTLIDKLNEM